MKTSRKIFLKLSNNLGLFLIVSLIIVVYFWKIFFKGLVPLPADVLVGAYDPWKSAFSQQYPLGFPFKPTENTDSISQFYPWKLFVADSFKKGEVPLWNPYVLSGIPFVATYHSAVFYPLNLLFTFLSLTTAWSIFVILQSILSLLFMYLYLRELKLSFWSSLTGGVIFSFSAYMMQWLELGPGGHAGLWLPLLLYLVEVNSKNSSWQNTFWGSIVICLSIFAGDFQTTFYSLIFVFFYAHFLRKMNFKTLGMFLFGILMAGVQLLPTIEAFPLSIRAVDSYKEVNYGILTFNKLIMFFAPDYFGNPATNNWFGQHYYIGSSAYVGVVSLIFVVSQIFSKKNKLVKFLFWTLLVTLIFIFENPIAHLPYWFQIPILKTNSANRLLFLTCFVMATLAAIGINKIIIPKNFKKYILIFWLSIVVYSLGKYLISKDNHYYISLRNLVFPTLILFGFLISTLFKKSKNYGLIIFILIFIDLFRFGNKFLSFSPKEFVFPSTQITDFLKSAGIQRVTGDISDNYLAVYKLHAVGGYESLYPQVYADFSDLIWNGKVEGGVGRYVNQQDYQSPLFVLTAARYLVSKDNAIESTLLTKTYENEGLTVYEYNNYLRPVRLVGKSVKIADWGEFPNLAYKVDFSKEVVLTGGSVLENSPIKSKVELITNANNKQKYQVETDKNAYLVISQTYYPGWNGYVDNRETNVLRANYAYNAIEIPPGNHIVDFVYEPKSFKIGLKISLISVLAIGFLAIY